MTTGAAPWVDQVHETFRNELASVAPDGRRRWIYARQPSGRLYRARTVVSWCLLSVLVAAPFVRVGGLPLVLFDVINRKFVLFGLLFWPQDLYQVVLIALAGLVTLALSTAAIGRVWCGWLCPQTVFMEMVFRKIEFLIEGSAAQQLRRNRGPWTVERLSRLGTKLAVFFALSFLIANIFLAYIIGSEALWAIVTDSPRRHLVGLGAITTFSVVFFLVFARFREQACVLACPYGRMMSALIDRHTVTVTYDTTRGEPRRRLTHDRAAAPAGDCVDCHQCVTVCPTGIDIRHGSQLECVSCTACIDACNDVMRRVGRPAGLIRHTTQAEISGKSGRWPTPRVWAYAGVWLALVGIVGIVLLRRPALDVVVLRQPGTLYATLPGGDIANFYNVQVFNRSRNAQSYDIRVVAPAGASVTRLGLGTQVNPHDLIEGRMLVRIPREVLSSEANRIQLEVVDANGKTERVDSSFVAPHNPASEIR